MLDQAEQDRVRRVAELLHQAARPMRVLGALAWAPEVKQQFLAGGGQQLPEVSYPGYDPGPVTAIIQEARRDIFPGNVVDDWLESQADAIASTAEMMASAGTSAFSAWGRRLYGMPTDPLRYDPVTPLALAHQVLESMADLVSAKLDVTPPATKSAEDIVAVIEPAVNLMFGDLAPPVQIVDQLSANALASRKHIRVRRGARFTDLDARQLLEHEAFIHVATAFNGLEQKDLPILAIGHAGTTRTQEGLAVFAELMSGTLDLDRFRRLAHRVIAIHMAMEGANFIEVFRWFAERVDEDQAFESTRRVFRGGNVNGGVAFLKDIVYLAGLLEVSTFVRGAFAAGRTDTLGILFCGKLDISGVPALAELRNSGLCVRPRFLPPWVSDPRHTLAMLTWSTFSSQIDLTRVTMAVERLLARTERVDISGSITFDPAPAS